MAPAVPTRVSPEAAEGPEAALAPYRLPALDALLPLRHAGLREASPASEHPPHAGSRGPRSPPRPGAAACSGKQRPGNLAPGRRRADLAG